MRGQSSSGDGTSDDPPDTAAPSAAAAAAGGEAARVVFASSPYWVYTSSWHCKHPDSTNEHSYLDTVGPATAEEVLRLYKNRQMKGSNLIVGLAANLLPCKQVPASFFRTLGYLFELAKSGISYMPVSQSELAHGSPDPSWCPPLWQTPGQSELLPGIVTDDTACDTLPLNPASDLTTAAESLLTSAPFWCYLYNHEPSRSKKTPPKSSEEMLSVLHSNCLPDWAPIIGLGKDVATFNSLPPCLFMTMGSLTNLVASGAAYRPVGLGELNRYDKFFNSRTTAGNTQGMQQLSQALSMPLQVLPSASLASHGAVSARAATAPAPQPYSDNNASYLAQQPSPAVYMPGRPPPQFMNASQMMWYSSFMPPGQVYPYVPLAPMPVPDSGLVHAGGIERSSAPEPAWRNPPARTSSAIVTQLSSPLPDEGDFQEKGKARQARVSEMGRSGARGARDPGWQTALFRLFLADSKDSRPEARWWLLAPGPAGNAALQGPFCSEEMILQYASGRLRDNQYICGTTANTPAPSIPTSVFQPVAKLLQMADSQAGTYVLFSAEHRAFMEEQPPLHGLNVKQRNRGGAARRSYKSHDGEGTSRSAAARNSAAQPL